MALNLEIISNVISKAQKKITSFVVSEREKLELQKLREEAAEEGGAGNFLAPTADGLKVRDGLYQELGVHIRGWKNNWHRWNGNRKEIFEDPSPQEIAEKNLKQGADLTVQVLEPADAMGTYILSLAPTSYFNWRNYVQSLGGLGLEPHKVLSVLSYRMKQYKEGNPVPLVQFRYVPFSNPEIIQAEVTTGTTTEQWK